MFGKLLTVGYHHLGNGATCDVAVAAEHRPVAAADSAAVEHEQRARPSDRVVDNDAVKTGCRQKKWGIARSV